MVIVFCLGCGTSGFRSVQVEMGDNTPVDRLLSFELVVNSISLTSTSGAKISLLAFPVTMEQSDLVAARKAITESSVPVGTYTAADVITGTARIVFADDFGNIVQQQLPGLSLAHIVLKPAIKIDAAASTVKIGLNIPSILKFDATQQRMVLGRPAFAVSQSLPGETDTIAQTTGVLEPTVGIVTAVDGSSFTVSDPSSGVTMEYVTNKDTAFEGLTLGTMQGLLVRVNAKTRAGGQWWAEEVNLVGSGYGSAVAGTLTNYTGTSMAAQQVYGKGASHSMLGSVMSMDLSQINSFQMDSTGMNVEALNLTFDAGSLVPGQRVQFTSSAEVQVDPNGSGGLLKVDIAQLQQQTISGTVANLEFDPSEGATFDLYLPANSDAALTILGGAPGFVHVVTQSLTSSAVGSLVKGASVKVRGLLLFTARRSDKRRGSMRRYVAAPPPASDYFMVARAIVR